MPLYMTRTPLRVSLFGGGTDYPEYFERHPGAVIGLAINKYIFISQLKLTAYQAYNYRVAYSKLDFAQSVDEIQHPVVREVLKHYRISDRLDISVMSDLPSSGSGLGSSSSFTVGFVNLVKAMQRKLITKIDLAREAIKVERELLQENVGVQDQLHATFGGLNRFDFAGERISIHPVQISADTLDALNQSMILVHTGIARRATETVAAQIEATKSKKIDRPLGDLYSLVGECVSTLECGRPTVLQDLGQMLNESWKIKRSLSTKVSNGDIDDLYDRLIDAGIYGAKLCGAGGGGFFFCLVESDRIEAVRKAVAPHAVIPIKMDVQGSAVIHQSAVSDAL